ncbi:MULTISPECIES: outer membrane protein [unclassified Roseitalea]|uniref:outer membrane protein n=1 Tax=unclassified Roseitalea TaxID=2639107 RepID=UPI00273E1630|nr:MULTISPECIES: outer membrane protein [unclassified Roseitalea]
MRRLAIICAASAAVMTGVAPAMAADAVQPLPQTPTAPPVTDFAPVSDWSGFYVGAFGGYNFGEFDTTAGDIDADGWSGGGFAGINLQNGAFVYGLEGDVGISEGDGTLVGPPSVTADQGLFGSLRARIGYDFNPFMLYGTAGVAATNVEVTDGTTTDENTHLGWTAGVGADAMLTQNVFGRLEYRYTDYQSKDFALTSPTPGTVSSGFTEQSIRAGIGFKF